MNWKQILEEQSSWSQVTPHSKRLSVTEADFVPTKAIARPYGRSS